MDLYHLKGQVASAPTWTHTITSMMWPLSVQLSLISPAAVNDFALNARRWPQGDSTAYGVFPVTHPVLVSICQTAVAAQWIGTFSLAFGKGSSY
jgi:hypothetical protein